MSSFHQGSAVRVRVDITESPGSARLPLHVMPGDGPVSTSCSAGLANDVDAGPSPGMTASYSRATVEAAISPRILSLQLHILEVARFVVDADARRRDPRCVRARHMHRPHQTLHE